MRHTSTELHRWPALATGRPAVPAKIERVADVLSAAWRELSGSVKHAR